MRLVKIKDDGELSLTADLIRDVPEYAILSHIWGANGEGFTLKDMLDGSRKKKTGYKKMEFCRAQAIDDGLRHFWVDTCCIDKTNNTELSEAINSMFKWYQNAAICYVYLSDVNEHSDLDSSRWFTRGWTLQELLAPNDMVFFNANAEIMDNRSNLSPTISRITKIPCHQLSLRFSRGFSAAQIMSWAATRQTTREEDMAYCLLDLLGIHLPLLYGEGLYAFERLQQEYMKIRTDHSLFAWQGSGEERGPFARSPAEFKHCTDVEANSDIPLHFSMTNAGLKIQLPLIRVEGESENIVAAVLNCRRKDKRPIAIYLKKLASGVYRRVLCTDIRAIGPSETIPSLETVYIAPPIQPILGRDQQTSPNDTYQLQVDFRTVLQNGFCLEKHRSANDDDDACQWDSTQSDQGFLVITAVSSRIYGGLWSKNEVSDEQFVVILGIHNFYAWLDVTDIDVGETFASVVDEYYHYRERHDENNSRCRCGVQWKEGLHCLTKAFSHGMSVCTSVDDDEPTHQVSVEILVSINE